MRHAVALLVLLSALLHSPVASQHIVRGTVRDAANGQPLPAANIREPGTTHGTITNNSGMFSLVLSPGKHPLVASMLGYRADSAMVDVPLSSTHEFRLTPAAIQLPEVVVTSEDPALAIVRKAIAARRRQAEKLLSYEMQAFTRQTIRRDTAVASITESFTTGYWQRGDTLREVVRQRRQTANVEASQNFASVGRILNFSEDEIRFAGYTFVGPTAEDALSYYRYRLLRTSGGSGGTDVFVISLTPQTRATPLFQGTIMIADGSFALVGVDVEPNEAFQIPFLHDRKLRYQQQFALYEGSYWMPVDVRIEARFELGIPGITFPPFAFSQTSVVSQYTINMPLPDSVLHGPRFTVDSMATRVDSSYWATHDVLPLNQEEQAAYASIDSSQTLDVQFRPGGIAATLGGGSEGAAQALSHLDASFDRAQGFRLGLRIDGTSRVQPVARLSYAFGWKKLVYTAGLTVNILPHEKFAVHGEAYRRAEHRPDHGYYAPAANSLAALFAKEDYFDFYGAEGWSVSLRSAPFSRVHLDLSYLHEWHRPLGVTTGFSIFYPSRDFRPNPAAIPGRFRSIRAAARFGADPVALDLAARDMLEVSVERASPRLTGGSFDFTCYNAAGMVSIPTIGRGMLFVPSLRLRAAAGTSSGTLPSQRLFALESSLAGLAPFGVMRAARPDEFMGTSYIAFNAEHNFRNLPFLALGIPFLYGVDFSMHGGAGRTWNRGLSPSPWYSELGLGLGRLFELFRADLTWRFAEPRTLRFTVGVSTLL